MDFISAMAHVTQQEEDLIASAIAAQMNADQIIRRLAKGEALWDAESVRRVARALADHGILNVAEPKTVTASSQKGIEAVDKELNSPPATGTDP